MVADGHTASFRHSEPTPHPELRSRLSAPATTSVVCRQCRARKVRCDRKEPCCSPCTRLRFVCSLGRHTASLFPERTPPDGLTQAGNKRKRVKRACQPCQLVKAKCSGTNPCIRCQGKGLSCDLELRHTARTSTSSPTPSNLSSIGGPHTSQSLPSTELLGLKKVPPCEKGEIQEHLDTYFRTASRSGMPLLHRPTILANWRKGTIEPALLKLMTSIGMFESSSDVGSESERTRARQCIQEVQDETLRYIGKQTITQLSILVLLLRFRFDVGDFAEAWTLIAIASRLVFTLRLNHEHEGLDASTQETIRRLVWTVYEIDRKCSGGIDYLTVCPVDKMYIRLPCDESRFEMALKSTLPYLEDESTGQNTYLGAHSCKLKLLATRDRILRYTKHIRKSGGDLSSTQAEMDSLQSELDIFKVSFPSEMDVSTQKLDLMVHSDEGLRCIELRTMWLLSHCDLYRHCIPGIRESASHQALSQTPSTFIDYCQRACFNGAVKLCNLWSELHNLQLSNSLGDGMMAVAIYQVAQIFHHLPHLLTLDDDIDTTSTNHGPKIDELQRKLLEAIEIVKPKHPTRSYLWANCVKDAEKLVAALGKMRRRWEETCTSPLPSDLSDMLDDHGTQHDHLQSRHHMLASIARDDRHSESSQRRQIGDPGGSADTQIVGSSTSSDALISRPHQPDFLTAANDVSNSCMSYMPDLSFMDYRLEDLSTWDPFDMVFNDYYDNNIEALSEPVPIQK